MYLYTSNSNHLDTFIFEAARSKVMAVYIMPATNVSYVIFRFICDIQLSISSSFIEQCEIKPA